MTGPVGETPLHKKLRLQPGQRALLLNAPQTLLPQNPFETDSETARKYAQKTLKLCASLGWSPSQVWEAPAAEVDRLLALIDLMEPKARKQSTKLSKLAQYPDTVVIRFEED